MGNYILCRHALSKSPYFIESVHLNVYSIEELCFFLSTNPALAQDVVSDEALVQWLQDECAVENAVKEYGKAAALSEGLTPRLMWIFNKSRFFTETELRALQAKVEELDAMKPVERQKKMGDALVKYGKYKRGIACYEKILGMEETAAEPNEFRASVYYNTGVAYEKLFQSGKALEFFYKAYTCEKSSGYLRSYLNAAYFDSGREGMIAQARKLGLKDAVISAHLGRLEVIEPYEKPEDTDKALEEWIRAYHISVDQ